MFVSLIWPRSLLLSDALLPQLHRVCTDARRLRRCDSRYIQSDTPSRPPKRSCTHEPLPRQPQHLSSYHGLASWRSATFHLKMMPTVRWAAALGVSALLANFASSTIAASVQAPRTAKPFAILAGAASVPIGYNPIAIRNSYGVDQADDLRGMGRLIAIVVAYHQPHLEEDFEQFISWFKLQPIAGIGIGRTCTFASGPHPCFRRAYSKSVPIVKASWALETAQDIEWAHAISPMADLLLVEAQSDQIDELLAAVDLAISWRANVVAMSWGTAETSLQLINDRHFDVAGTAFVAAIGDAPGTVAYPGVSPYVVSVGGTSLRLDKQNRRLSETAWSRTGGGVSEFEPQPAYQAWASALFSPRLRTVPDVAAHADVENGYAVTSTDVVSAKPMWYRAAGSSGAAIVWAALISLASADCSWHLDVDPYVAHLYRDATIGLTSWRYDLQTGLGPPDARQLLPNLCAPGERQRRA